MSQFENWHFTKGAVEPPQAYVDYALCAHVYHCTPADLDQQDALTVDLHLEFWNREQEAASGKKVKHLGKRQRSGEQQHVRDHHQSQRPSLQDLIQRLGEGGVEP
jgi:hypothetical protein